MAEGAINPDAIPPIIRKRKWWAVYRNVQGKRVPWRPDGAATLKWKNALDHIGFEEALELFEQGRMLEAHKPLHFGGIGFILPPESEEVRVIVIDLDDCIDDQGNLTTNASKFIERFGTYAEWSPLGRGLLTERYLNLAKIGPGDRLVDEGLLEEYADNATMAKLHQLAQLARQWDLKLNQLALAYMLTLPGMGPVIPFASSVEHLESNAAAGKVTLSDEQKSRVKEILAV